MACTALASLIRTPWLYAASYGPAATALQTPGQFRKTARERWLVDGTITVMRVQALFGAGKNAAMDWFMTHVTDLCDSGFYFLALPMLNWLVDVRLARWITILTTIGVALGGTLKDLYRLPRPPAVLVWRQHAGRDSTGAKDFGFVSTHTANAVTNAFVVVMFYYYTGVLSMSEPLVLLAALVLASMYPVIIGLSRLYLGLHTPLDVIGGTSLGALLVVVGHTALPRLDAALETYSPFAVFGAVVVAAAWFAAAHPQPRPHTVTFLHDMELFGLALSCVMGGSLLRSGILTAALHDALAPLGAPSLGPWLEGLAGPYALPVARVLIGFVASGLSYVTAKIVGPPVVNALLGVDAKRVRREIEAAPSPQEALALEVAARVVTKLRAQGGDALSLLSRDDADAVLSKAGDKAADAPPAAADAVGLSEVPIPIVTDEPARRGVELGACAALKLFTYITTGTGIIAGAAALHAAFGLSPVPYS